MQAISHARDLHEEALRANERRMLVLEGEASAGRDIARAVLDTLPVAISDTLAISDHSDWVCEQVAPERSATVMGQTLELIVLDLHEATIPNAIGRATGAVDGGGLLVVLAPSFDAWPNRRDAFDERLVVAPYEIDDVKGGFKAHVIDALESHPGIGIVDTGQDRVRKSGITGAERHTPGRRQLGPPRDHRFAEIAYEHCRSRDQTRVLREFERLTDDGEAVVVSAERGRGKSSVAGMAAALLATQGDRVVITAPEVENVRTTFEHAAIIAEATDVLVAQDRGDRPAIDLERGSVTYYPAEHVPRRIAAGRVDALFVDEAAGVPVPILEDCLACGRIGLMTTLFGYEGTGQGFAHRFRDALEEGEHRVTSCQMEQPIRYAPGDPIETWLNRALLLDARPAVAEAVDGIDLASARYRRWDSAELRERENLLREIVGLLATAHYRTEPNDVARILDAPNLAVVALQSEASVLCVGLVAREGDLSAEKRAEAFRGERLRGNMLPDIFINAYRDPTPAGDPGLRIVRIATHEAVRRQGLASRLLDEIRADWGTEVAWIGTGFGVTPDLVRFWRANHFVPIFLGASRNASSGVQSVAMLDQSTGELGERYADRFPGRLRGSLNDVHRELDPIVAEELLRSVPCDTALSIEEDGWRGLVAAADGPGRYDLDPEPARELVLHHLTGGAANDPLDSREVRLLVTKVLQGRSWPHVAEGLDYPSVGQARRALGDALAKLVDRYGGDAAEREREQLARDGKSAEVPE